MHWAWSTWQLSCLGLIHPFSECLGADSGLSTMLGPGETKGMTERREPCSYNLMESAYKQIKQTEKFYDERSWSHAKT